MRKQKIGLISRKCPKYTHERDKIFFCLEITRKKGWRDTSLLCEEEGGEGKKCQACGWDRIQEKNHTGERKRNRMMVKMKKKNPHVNQQEREKYFRFPNFPLFWHEIKFRTAFSEGRFDAGCVRKYKVGSFPAPLSWRWGEKKPP